MNEKGGSCMSSYAIEVRGLQKRFGEQQVLNGVDLAVSKGEIFALLGPNGAGKTTLINILTTLCKPDSGSVMVGGYQVTKENNKVKESISLTGQFAAVDEMLTAAENLQMMGKLSGLSSKEARSRTQELIRQFDLLEVANKQVKSYSGGMRRRLDLAVSLVVRRPIIFLDEPTTGLDTRSRRTLWDIIKNLASEGVTVFLTTQYLEEADELADRIAVLMNGKIVSHGTPEVMKSQFSGEILELRNGNDEVIYEVPTNGSIEELKKILSDIDFEIPHSAKINIRKPSLDDVFLDLTAAGKERAL
jgi:ABC-2 type transport system ATP-binding protein